LASLDFAEGRAGISLFDAEPRSLPYRLEMVERHPEGSQAFIPMTMAPFLVIVAPDEKGAPGRPQAFVTAPGQGINFHRGIWHGVLTPLSAPGLFAVIDRIGDGPNLEEHWFTEPYDITPD
jgi:ureidoglycolate lyase